jgi:hypothetical protein
MKKKAGVAKRALYEAGIELYKPLKDTHVHGFCLHLFFFPKEKLQLTLVLLANRKIKSEGLASRGVPTEFAGAHIPFSEKFTM